MVLPYDFVYERYRTEELKFRIKKVNDSQVKHEDVVLYTVTH